jgi:hypothetical protein
MINGTTRFLTILKEAETGDAALCSVDFVDCLRHPTGSLSDDSCGWRQFSMPTSFSLHESRGN